MFIEPKGVLGEGRHGKTCHPLHHCLTCLLQMFFEDNIDDSKYCGHLFGLGTTFSSHYSNGNSYRGGTPQPAQQSNSNNELSSNNVSQSDNSSAQPIDQSTDSFHQTDQPISCVLIYNVQPSCVLKHDRSYNDDLIGVYCSSFTASCAMLVSRTGLSYFIICNLCRQIWQKLACL